MSPSHDAQPVSLDYAGPGIKTHYHRPALLTVVAIFGIVLGLSTTVVNIWRSPSAVDFHAMTNPALGANLTALPAAGLTPYPGEVVGAGGLGRAERQAVRAAIRRKAQLSPDQQITLDELLAEIGAEAFPRMARPLTAETVAAVVQCSRQTQSVTHADQRIEFFEDLVKTPGGVLRISAHRAIFDRSDGRSARVENSAFINYSGAKSRCASALTESISRLHRAHSRINSLQAAALVAELRNVAADSDDDEAAIVLLEARIWSAGTVEVVFPDPNDRRRIRAGGRVIWILARGAVVDVSQGGANLDPATGMPPLTQVSYLPTSRWAAAFIMVEPMLFAALGGVMVISSIMILANRGAGVELLRLTMIVRALVAVPLLVAKLYAYAQIREASQWLQILSTIPLDRMQIRSWGTMFGGLVMCGLFIWGCSTASAQRFREYTGAQAWFAGDRMTAKPPRLLQGPTFLLCIATACAAALLSAVLSIVGLASASTSAQRGLHGGLLFMATILAGTPLLMWLLRPKFAGGNKQ